MPYRIEICPNNRATCKNTECKANKVIIPKGELRFGTFITIQDHQSWAYKHWGCVTPQQLGNVQTELDNDPENLDGYEELPDDIKQKIAQAIQQGHVDDEDWRGDVELNRPGMKGFRVKTPKKNREEGEEDVADIESPSKGKGKGKKRVKKDDDDEEEDEAPKKKKSRGKAKKVADLDDDDLDDDEPEAPPPKKQRGKPKATKDDEVEVEASVPAKAKGKGKGKKAAKSEQEENGVEDDADEEKPKKTKTSKKKAPETTTADVAKPKGRAKKKKGLDVE